MRLPGRTTTIPSSEKIHNPATGEKAGRRSAPTVRKVVGTLTLKVAGTVALNGSLAGTEQLAPVGEPVQLSDAVPLSPAPPIDSVYLAVCPATTVAELESPEGTPRPRLAFPV